MERGQDGAQKLRVSFHGLFLESGRKGSKNKRKISTIVSSRERCIPWFKVLHFGISPWHTRAPEPDGLPEGEFLFAMDFQILERDYSLLEVQIAQIHHDLLLYHVLGEKQTG